MNLSHLILYIIHLFIILFSELCNLHTKLMRLVMFIKDNYNIDPFSLQSLFHNDLTHDEIFQSMKYLSKKVFQLFILHYRMYPSSIPCL